MKNNPFLNKKSNDRFNFFDQNSSKDNIKVKSKDKRIVNDTVLKKDDTKSRFKNTYSNSNKLPDKQFIISDADFPVLIKTTTDNTINDNTINDNTINDNTINDNTTNYKDIITSNDYNSNLSQQNNIPPGHIEISSINGKICFKNGPLTPYQIRQNYYNNYKEQLSNDVHYNMNNAINFMKNNWDKFRLEYDSIYGEGSYQDKFLYKIDYDSDDDNNDTETSDLETDYENDIDIIDYYENDYLV
jgi:hypothetical protein